jgi:hypothetical protein
MKPKIPAGWRWLRNGTVILEGDKLLNALHRDWIKIDEICWGRPPICKVGDFGHTNIHIRRLHKRASARKGRRKP